MNPLWGIDLGGTKIEGVILKGKEDPKPIARLRVPTNREKGYDHILNQIGVLIDQLKEESGLEPTRIGMGMPGTLDPITKLGKNSNTTAINGKPLQDDLEAKFGIPFRLANDANCFAIAEAQMGVVKEKMPEAKVVFGVIMGTGVGGGLVINGEVLGGRHGIAGEWGHNHLDDSGGVCYCGKIGCVETVISGTGLERFYEQRTGNKIKLKEIVARQQAGSDPFAIETIERLIYYFGKGIAGIINVLDPDAIVLGGGLGNIDVLYSRGVEAVHPHLFNARLDTVFLKPKLGDSAGVFGAAFL